MACIFKPGDKVIYKRLYNMNREYLKEGEIYTILTIATYVFQTSSMEY